MRNVKGVGGPLVSISFQRSYGLIFTHNCLKFSLLKMFVIVIYVIPILMLTDISLDFSDSTVFLGITIDSKLQRRAHIYTLSKKLSSATYAVRKNRQLADIEIIVVHC